MASAQLAPALTRQMTAANERFGQVRRPFYCARALPKTKASKLVMLVNQLAQTGAVTERRRRVGTTELNRKIGFQR